MLRDKIRTAFFIISSMLIHSAALLAITMSPGFLQKMGESIGAVKLGDTAASDDIVTIATEGEEVVVIDEPAAAEVEVQVQVEPVAVREVKPEKSDMNVTMIKKTDIKEQPKAKEADAKKKATALPEKMKVETTEKEVKVVVFEEEEESTEEKAPVDAEENLGDIAAAVATSEALNSQDDEIKSETLKELAAGTSALPAPKITPEPKATSPAEKMAAATQVVPNTEPIDQPMHGPEEATVATAKTAEETEVGEITESQNVGSDVMVVEPATSTQASGAQVFYNLKQLPGNQPPTYPQSARIKKAEGAGQLRYLVTKEGVVKDLELLESTGHQDLDVAMMNAVKDYRFVPGQEGVTVHPFAFKLKGPELPTRGRLRTTQNREPVQ